MNGSAAPAHARWSPRATSEVRKLAAFLRRDLLVALSYRTAIVSDWLVLGLQVVIFAFVSRMIEPSSLPSFGGRPSSYLEFVAVGIAVGAVLQLGLSRAAQAIRREQTTGTLEYLLTTPTSLSITQLGSVIFDAVYIPLRTVLFLALCAAALDVRFSSGDILPATVVLTAFVPVVWGMGIAAAGAIMTFRRGGGGVGLASAAMAVTSGAYFPLDLFPGWAQELARLNPIAVTLDAMRDILLGGAGWTVVVASGRVLVPMGVVALAVGSMVFRASVRREIRRGTIGLY